LKVSIRQVQPVQAIEIDWAGRRAVRKVA